MTFTVVGSISNWWCVGIVSNDDVRHVVSQGVIDNPIMGVSKKHSVGAHGQIYGHATKTHSLAGAGPTRDAAIDDLLKKILAKNDISLKLSDGSFVKIPAAESAAELKLKLDVLEPL